MSKESTNWVREAEPICLTHNENAALDHLEYYKRRADEIYILEEYVYPLWALFSTAVFAYAVWTKGMSKGMSLETLVDVLWAILVGLIPGLLAASLIAVALRPGRQRMYEAVCAQMPDQQLVRDFEEGKVYSRTVT